MSLLVIGTIAFDDIETPHGRVSHVLGGSAVHFAYAASLFGPVRLVGATGHDFPDATLEPLRQRGVDLSGVTRLDHVPTFYWSGRYAHETSDAETLAIELNTLEVFEPLVPETFRSTPYVFLSADHPKNHLAAIAQLARPKLLICDTRDIWIETQPEGLREVIRRTDGIVLNDHEARQLARQENLMRAARAIMELGARLVIIKKGEHGAIMVAGDEWFALPAYPVEKVVDPTGAGDSFAGGLMGAVAAADAADFATLKRAMVWGTIIASRCVEDFSVRPLESTTLADLETRRVRFLRALSVS
ncbi:MAG: PfkB family carbohydrate kinase [Planctomycetota bacterium]